MHACGGAFLGDLQPGRLVAKLERQREGLFGRIGAGGEGDRALGQRTAVAGQDAHQRGSGGLRRGPPDGDVDVAVLERRRADRQPEIGRRGLDDLDARPAGKLLKPLGKSRCVGRIEPVGQPHHLEA
jgi:hypothetical protein